MRDSVNLKANPTKRQKHINEREKLKNKLPQSLANAVTCRIQIWKVLRATSPHEHHIQDKNDIIESKKLAAGTSKDKIPMKKSKNYETGLQGFSILQKQFYKLKETHKRTSY